MTYEHRATQANDIPDPGPARGEYDENAVREGVRQMMAEERQRQKFLALAREEVEQEIDALKTENARLLGCIAELEREGLEPDTTPCPGCGQQVDFGDVCSDCEAKAEKDFQEWLERRDHHNACEASWNGRIDN